jgi:hypothetical protein
MPEGKGYTPSELQTLRDHGKLPPSDIEILRQGGILSPSQSDYVRKTLTGGGAMRGMQKGSILPRTRGAKGGTRRSRSQGYKYFPDN